MVGRKLSVEECGRVLDGLLQQSASSYFVVPVDTSRHADYTQLVKKPMDLGTLKHNLEEGLYNTDTNKFLDDLNLVWTNTYAYNTKHSQQYKYAQHLQQVAEKHIQRILRDPRGAAARNRPRKDIEADVCGICGEGGRLLICDGDCLQAFHIKCLGLIR